MRLQGLYWWGLRGLNPGPNDYEICDYIGMDITVVIRRAEQRITEDLGPYPPLAVDLSQLPEDEKVAYVLDKVKAGDQSLAAMKDPNKEKEAEGGDGR